jgi:hypothetical protein
MPELDEFLGGAEPEEEKIVETPEVVAEAPAEVVEEPEAEPEAPTKPEATDPPEPGDVTGLKSALQAERAKRNDWKSEAARVTGELAAIKAQMEALQKAPPAPTTPAAPTQPAVIPNPVEDPQGYHAHIQQTLFNDKLNMSEMMLRQQVGNDADVDAKREKFRQMAAANPALRMELQKAAHPYKFVYDTAAKAMALDEIGDPASYRTKLEAEIRASVMAEMAGAAPAPAARVVLPQSLGTARSAGSRNVPVINAPEAFDDILAVARK